MVLSSIFRVLLKLITQNGGTDWSLNMLPSLDMLSWTGQPLQPVLEMHKPCPQGDLWVVPYLPPLLAILLASGSFIPCIPTWSCSGCFLIM